MEPPLAAASFTRMKQVTLEVPDEAVRRFGDSDPKRFAREMLTAAVLQWFEEGELSQGQAAEMLGLNRGAFFDVLHQHRVSPVQMSVADLEADFRRG